MKVGRAYWIGAAASSIIVAYLLLGARDALTSTGDYAMLHAGWSRLLAGDTGGFWYPPLSSFYALLALLPRDVGSWLWTAGGMVLAAGGLAIALGASRRRGVSWSSGGELRLVESGRWRKCSALALAVCGVGLFASQPAMFNYVTGQFGFLLVGAWGIAYGVRGGWIAAAVVAIAKPHVLGLYAILATYRAGWRAASAAALTLWCAYIVLELVDPGWHSRWFSTIAGFHAVDVHTATFDHLLGSWSLLAGIAAAAAVVVMRWDRELLVPVLAAVVAPYIRGYDHLLLYGPLAVASSRAGSSFLIVACVGFALLSYALEAVVRVSIGEQWSGLLVVYVALAILSSRLMVTRWA